MTFNPEDPKWTAYVLGELENAERAEMDSLLESSEEARAYVEELRVATGALENELKVELKVGFPPEINAELAASLTDAQRAAIQAAAGAANTANNIRWFRQPQAHQVLFGGLAIAAMILIAIAIPSVWKAQKGDEAADKPAQSAAALKTEESISPSPAVTSESVSKPEGRNEISKSSDSKVPPAEQREAIVIRAQSDES
jgi:anti-sigma factor RsiW